MTTNRQSPQKVSTFVFPNRARCESAATILAAALAKRDPDWKVVVERALRGDNWAVMVECDGLVPDGLVIATCLQALLGDLA